MIEHGCNGAELVEAVRQLQEDVEQLTVEIVALCRSIADTAGAKAVPHNGVLVKQLLDEAFRVLRSESDEDEEESSEDPWLRVELGKAFWKILVPSAKAEGEQA